MMLVFFIGTFVSLTFIFIILSTITIKTQQLEISNCNNDKKLKYDYEIFLELHFLNKIKILGFKIDKEKLEKIDIKQKMKKVDFKKVKKELPDKEDIKEIVQKLDIDLTKLDLKMEIGTEDVLITTGLVTILASVLGIGLAKVVKEYKEDRYSYEIYPIYQNRNLIKVGLNCIIKVKVVHIIHIIYLLLKKRRVKKNERTSNRRTYGYGYE